RGHLAERPRPVQVPRPPLEAGLRIQAVARGEGRELRLVQAARRLVALPYVVAPFLALRVGVEAAGKAARRQLHLAHQPPCRLLAYLAEQRLAARLPGLGVQAQQRPVVVEHLLEMRDAPLRIRA